MLLLVTQNLPAVASVLDFNDRDEMAPIPRIKTGFWPVGTSDLSDGEEAAKGRITKRHDFVRSEYEGVVSLGRNNSQDNVLIIARRGAVI